MGRLTAGGLSLHCPEILAICAPHSPQTTSGQVGKLGQS
jgi:hypothetical protein